MMRNDKMPLSFAALALLLAACATGPTPPPVDPAPIPENGATLWVAGDVEDVIAGRVPPAAKQWIDASSFDIGFEAGSPHGLSSLGEFIALNGTAYAKSTDPESPDYYQLIHGPRFVTTGAVFIPHAAEPAFNVYYNAPSPDETITLAELYDSIAELTEDAAFAFAGEITFAECRSLAIARAPIHGEVIFDHREAYYPFGETATPNVSAVVMGCAADFARETDPDRRAALTRVLYDNPYDTATGLTTHAHALLLNRDPDDWRAVTPADATDVAHLLSQSVIEGYDLEIYPIAELNPISPSNTY